MKIVENRSNVLDMCVKQDHADYASQMPFDHCHCSLHRTDTIMSDDSNLAYCHTLAAREMTFPQSANVIGLLAEIARCRNVAVQLSLKSRVSKRDLQRTENSSGRRIEEN